MKLTIEIERPQTSPAWTAWLELGGEDPTRLSLEHEQNLVLDLAEQGAQLVLVRCNTKAILRYLVHPMLAREGCCSVGFFALAQGVDQSMLNQGFAQSLQMIQAAFPHMTLKKLLGPINGNTWFAYRLRVDFHPLQFDWEPQPQPRLRLLLEEAGFVDWAHYHSVATAGLKALQADIYPNWKHAVERGFALRPISGKELQGGALVELHRLSQVGFADNPLFVPLSFQAFARSYLQGKSTKENYLYAAYEPLGRCVAYFLAFLEPTHAGQEKTLVLKTAATDPNYRRQGISNALLYALCQDLPPAVSDVYYSALVFQGWSSESYGRHGDLLWQHRYVLMGRELRG